MTSLGSIAMVTYNKYNNLSFFRFVGVARDTDKLWHESNTMLRYYS